MMRLGFVFLALLGCSYVVALPTEEISTGSLAKELYDLPRLAEMPAPFFKVAQFSSYDRTSALPGGPGWFANADGFGGEPIPNFEGVVQAPENPGKPGEYLICDVEGPGAIVREWTARIRGTVRVYLDGAEKPVFDGPAEQFFMRPYDGYADAAGFDKSILERTLYQRNAAYCPIPFAKHCRVVWLGKLSDTHFYQLEARKYDAAAQVRTFSPEDLRTYAEALRTAADRLKNPDIAPEGTLESFSVTLTPGERKEGWKTEQAGAIAWLKLRVEGADRDLALRQTIFHGIFDGYPSEQIQSPVGDFFGAAPGVNPYTSPPFSVFPDGNMVCRFLMPFQKSASLAFENLGLQDVRIAGEAVRADHVWDEARSMHFRARWRIDHGLTGDGAAPVDLPFLLAQGAGTYVGTASYVLNPNNVPSSGGNWWGEGDEKIFTDDDSRPSLFGTGSEDYYNYAWSAGDLFFFPYCGQPVNTGPANRGFVANYRWHILDPLPFRQRMAFYMELMTHERNEGMAYARIGYHYARPGLIDDHRPITQEAVRPQHLPDKWIPAARGAAERSVFFQAENHIRKAARSQLEENERWSGGELYRWLPEKAGEELEFAAVLDQKAEYNVSIALALDARSGRVPARIDGKPFGFGGSSGIVNLYDPHHVLLRAIGGKPVKLKTGHHILALRYEGGEPGAGIGVDFLWFQKR